MSFKKYYPFDQTYRSIQEGPRMQYTGVNYVGDEVSIYDNPLHTSIYSQEDIKITLNEYNRVGSQRFKEAKYTETRQMALLPYRPEQYKCCLYSAFIPATAIYLFEWNDTVVPDNPAVPPYDKYTVTVEYCDGATVTSVTEPLIFVPYYSTDSNPNSIKRVFNVDQVIQSINNALSAAYTSLSGAGVTAEPATLYMDSDGLINILFDYSQQGVNNINIQNPLSFDTNEEFIRISFNFWVAKFFGSSFPSVVLQNEISNLPYMYIKLYNRIQPNYTVSINSVNYWNVKQQNSTIDLFSDIEKIVVLSNLRTRPSYTNILGVGSSASVPSSMSSINSLGEFNYSLSSVNNADISKPIIYYTKLHQWLDILGTEPLEQLSYQLFCLRQNGILTPIEIEPASSCSIKLLFSLK